MNKQSSSFGWVVTLSGTAINLALGALYSWSVMKKPLEAAFGLNDKQSALPYSVAVIVFALMMVPAGKLQDKIGPRFVAIVGGILVGIGFFVASLASQTCALPYLVVGFGVLAGAGIGFGYASATPPAIKWFHPSKKGLIVGLVVGGFGLASVYVAPLTEYLIYSKVEKPKAAAAAATVQKDSIGSQINKLKAYLADPAAANAAKAAKKKADTEAAMLAKAREAAKAKLSPTATPEEVAAAEAAAMTEIQTTTAETAKAAAAKYNVATSYAFRTLSIVFGIVVLIFAQFLKNPPAGYKPEAPASQAAKKVVPGAAIARDYSASEMLKTPQFYLIWLMFVFGAGAGLMVISFMAKLAKEMADVGLITVAGFKFVAILAIGNASGRIIAGVLSDKIGRTRAMFLVFVIQAVVLVLFPGFGNNAAVVAGALIVGFNYGACLSLFPSITADYYGLKNLGINYGLIFTAWGVGGFIMPAYIAGTIKNATGLYDLGFYTAAILCVIAALMTFLVKPPAAKVEAK